MYLAEDYITNKPISMKTWASMLANSPISHTLAQDLSDVIRGTNFSGVFFETPGVSSDSAHLKDMRICIIQADNLAHLATVNASPAAFLEHLNKAPSSEDACLFPNLGQDAQLVAPLKKGNFENVSYSHLVAFLRGTSPDQIAGVWKKVAQTFLEQLSSRPPEKPFWLSTSGEGVPWLHFRLDDIPKYYWYSPFAIEE